MRWKVWYANGEIYASDDCRWQDLPYSGVQAVLIYEDNEFKPGRPYTKTWDGCDWYYLVNGVIEGIPSHGWDGFRPKPCGVPEDCIKQGTAVSDALFDEITRQVHEAVRCP